MLRKVEVKPQCSLTTLTACMRMRQLGKGQSVVFCVPEEILHKIWTFASKPSGSPIDVSDVLAWSLSETWIDAKRCMALWANQGKRYQRQQKLWTPYQAGGAKTLTRDMADCFLEAEAQTLRQKYRPESCKSGLEKDTKCATEAVDEIDRRSREFLTESKQASLRQEAERELSPEAEEEKEVEKPEPAEALAHKLHNHVVRFVESGEVLLDSRAYMPAFESLSHTSAALRADVVPPDCKNLFVTADFANTVALSGKSSLMDSYQRPVQWILTRRKPDTDHMEVDFMMVISPFEAQQLMTRVMRSKQVCLHIYAPRPNLGYQPLDSLQLYTMPEKAELQIPQPLITRLNLFSGQLYFKSWREYTEACDFLGVAWEAADADEESWLSGNTLSHLKAQCNNGSTGFLDSLTVLMKKIRRSCEDIERTHVGTILGRRMLMPYHFAVADPLGA